MFPIDVSHSQPERRQKSPRDAGFSFTSSNVSSSSSCSCACSCSCLTFLGPVTEQDRRRHLRQPPRRPHLAPLLDLTQEQQRYRCHLHLHFLSDQEPRRTRE